MTVFRAPFNKVLPYKPIYSKTVRLKHLFYYYYHSTVHCNKFIAPTNHSWYYFYINSKHSSINSKHSSIVLHNPRRPLLVCNSSSAVKAVWLHFLPREQSLSPAPTLDRVPSFPPPLATLTHDHLPDNLPCVGESQKSMPIIKENNHASTYT